LAFFVAACGGTSVAIPDDAGAPGVYDSATEGGDGGASGRDATSADAPGASSCDDLYAQIAQQKADAQTCCPTCKSIQCSAVVQDLCCPISVQAAKADQLTALIQQFNAACHHACPAIPCPRVSMQCDPNTSTCK
jgi:hypothetical protein